MDILLGLASLAAFYFVWRTIILTKRVEQLSKELILKRYTAIDDENIAKDNFFKFISDSREWAYEYIEEVQNGLAKFINAVDSDIEHFDKYGEVIWTPLSKSMQNISTAYKDLKNLLPEDSLND